MRGLALVLVLSAAAFLAIAGASPARLQAGPGGPNVVVVLTDDQAALDGRLIASMPHTKAIFRDHGITFADFHGETPLCCPARAGFLTGQHTHNHGVDENRAALFDPQVTLATALRDAGYHTFLVGKYFNGYGECSGINCAPNVPPGWDRWAAFGDGGYYNYDLWIDGREEHHGTGGQNYSTDVLAAKAVSLIEQAPTGRPLFAWITPFGPHGPNTPAPRYASAPCNVAPWSPPSWNEADVSDKPLYIRQQPQLTGSATGLKTHCRTLLAVDDLVGAVRDALARTGRLDDTIFVFGSDNGMHLGEHRLTEKRAPYQTQIPFYLSWPAGLGTSPKTISERLQNIDLGPTLCELAGCSLGPYPNGQASPDGVSFASLLSDPGAALGRSDVLGEFPVALKETPGWHAVTTTDESPLRFTGCDLAPQGRCRWHYIEYETGERELYDVSNGPCWTWLPGQAGDPCELENAVDRPENAGLVALLGVQLTRLKTERGRG